MTKLEEVARAIGENIHLAWLWDERSARICDPAKVAEYHEMLEKAARAAIEAMREPTGAMIDGGANTLWPPTTKTLDGQPSKCWQAMITAALAGEAEGEG